MFNSLRVIDNLTPEYVGIKRAEMEIASIAKITFDNLHTFSTEVLDDGFSVNWQDSSKLKQDRHIMLTKLALSNEELMPEEIHELWLENKIADGWQFDFNHNRETKTTAHMVAFPDLPSDIKAKTFLFLAQIEVLRNFLD